MRSHACIALACFGVLGLTVPGAAQTAMPGERSQDPFGARSSRLNAGAG